MFSRYGAVWPAEVEECIAGETLPTAELDLDVGAFGRVCCSMLDIPVHQSLKESLHVLFTLYAAAPAVQEMKRGCGSNSHAPRRYLEFKATQDFQAGGEDVFGALRS